MAKFLVTLEETVRYTVEVEADNQLAAEELAPDIWAASEDPTQDFLGEGQGVEVCFSRPSAGR
ncbi:DpnD/PcfM family protein [Rhizobium sp. Leaf383]|uniref:DpnD/PcfM family protein n=1 Tax=Rhizobium sp. Leaf383 TaxID=1736357 RepID=UPI000713B80A|nr:DpnD/PcfM family protein [Rhizobium sp. Leaf383]KQS84304.1 hypothetical protein ASG58_21275 [Rhizobium sp. Leaf383]